MKSAREFKCVADAHNTYTETAEELYSYLMKKLEAVARNGEYCFAWKSGVSSPVEKKVIGKLKESGFSVDSNCQDDERYIVISFDEVPAPRGNVDEDIIISVLIGIFASAAIGPIVYVLLCKFF